MSSTPDQTPDTTPAPAPAIEDQEEQEPETSTTQREKLPIKTHHCRFCNHLLLATTRQITSLPARSPPAQDSALILPLLSSSEANSTSATNTSNDNDDGKRRQKHYTILLSTTVPDRKPTLIRREDGFEKRLFLRCGRCRVIMGYFLDPVHFEGVEGSSSRKRWREQGLGNGDEEGEEGEAEEGARVVYLLPAALVETDSLEDEETRKALDREWSGWFADR